MSCDFTNKHGNKLHVGKLEFKTKHGNDSLMQDIKKSAINEEVHANSFGKVSEFIFSMTPRNKRI